MRKRIFAVLSGSEIGISLWFQLFGVGGIVSSFGITVWAASATRWLASFGPLAWVACGFLGALLFVGLAFLWAMVRLRVFQSKLYERRASEKTDINILEDNFFKKIIILSDVYDVFHQINRNKTFRECRFSGPMVMSFGNNVTITESSFNECNYIVVSEGWLRGVVAFSDSTFRGCEFDSITFVIPPNLARMIRDSIGGDTIKFLGERLEP